MEIGPAVNYHGFRDAMHIPDFKQDVEQTMANATQRQVKNISTRLRQFYELGRQVVAADAANPIKGEYSRGVVQKFADKQGRSRDNIEKARQFALAYTEEEFEELATARNPDGLPMGAAHITLLLRIKAKKQRTALQKKALREGWSFEQLRQAVKARSRGRAAVAVAQHVRRPRRRHCCRSRRCPMRGFGGMTA